MKKSITGVVALLAGAFVAHSQGTISLGDYLAGPSGGYVYVSLGTTPLGGTASHTGNSSTDTGDGNDWTVALYGAAGNGATTLAPLLQENNTPATANLESGPSSGDNTPGTWATAVYGVVPGNGGNGQAATVQLYAWYNDNGTYTSYSAAQTAGVPTGFSAVANTTTGGPGTSGPAGTPTALPNGLGNITLTPTASPEPSTIALGVMGASAFLLRLRKKQ
jgi:hypothetical protein